MINDTIAAISTPPGESGIGIIRLSGPLAIDIADKIFFAKNSKKPSTFKSHVLHYGHVKSGSKAIDEALLAVMRKPATYTREDMVEINCHGGIVCLTQALNLSLDTGARLADPGEFTKRAFLSGRIDLIQAEAVCDIIASRTDESLSIAQSQLKGDTSREIKLIRSELIEIAARLEADINFPEEDIRPSDLSSVRSSLACAVGQLLSIVDFAKKGVILREGITTVICGKPNVGKSSLMNSFLRHDRVIVAPLAGTTRDTIEEVVNVRGIPLKIVDTAGIIHAQDDIMEESVKRSMRYMEVADIILLVLDSSDILTEQDLSIIDVVKDRKVLVVVNKSDLPEVLQVSEIERHLHSKVIIRVSAKEKSGIEDLEKAIYDMFFLGQIPVGSILLSNSRQIEAAKKAIRFVESAINGIDGHVPEELLMIDIRDATESLGVITGEIFTEEILDTIFSKFCIGK